MSTDARSPPTTDVAPQESSIGSATPTPAPTAFPSRNDAVSTSGSNSAPTSTPASVTSGTANQEPKPVETTTIKTTEPTKVTGVSPEKILEEFKKSGYFDQLRRQMFDAFVAAQGIPSNAVNAKSGTDSQASATATSASASQSDPSRSSQHISASEQPSPNAPVTSANTVASNLTEAPPAFGANSAPAMTVPGNGIVSNQAAGLGDKRSFLNTLDGVIRQRLEQDRTNLRFLDQRNQLDNLLKYLDSDPAFSSTGTASADDGGTGTLFELLTSHIVKSAKDPNQNTSGLLSRDGRIGLETNAKIKALVADLVNPTRKATDGAEEDEEDEEEDAEDETAHEEIRQIQKPVTSLTASDSTSPKTNGMQID
ncbi:hypothetical protein BCV70DRAFT_123632 [Testicularia cyperi]|uniref:Uncharacterized protein n=1 Tax=Testicularia cyperi TaxID=1882483 RepID=A0A317XMK9_9BASI|nr:hypothetical protein BCV70DRAFT_123632 [Testicularia cyperi]